MARTALTVVIDRISQLSKLGVDARIDAYNALNRASAALIEDVYRDPVLAVQLVPSDRVRANDYNPNKVASPEMALLELSIDEDGITMPIVTVASGDGWEVVDGYHRRVVLCERKGRKHVPVSVIRKDAKGRIAATIRHNRARGKHQVDLMAAIVQRLLALGWQDAKIAEHIGMTPEELLRLKQIVGVAPLLAGSAYSRAWGTLDEEI